MTLSQLINKLPQSIQDKIISYTYNLQPKSLRDDIIHFHQSYDFICTYYYELAFSYAMTEKYSMGYHHIPYGIKDYWKAWFRDDLVQYMNNDKCLLYNVYDKLIMMTKRVFQFNSSNFRSFRSNLQYTTKHRLIWGSFTMEEREQFMTKYPIVYHHYENTKTVGVQTKI